MCQRIDSRRVLVYRLGIVSRSCGTFAANYPPLTQDADEIFLDLSVDYALEYEK